MLDVFHDVGFLFIIRTRAFIPSLYHGRRLHSLWHFISQLSLKDGYFQSSSAFLQLQNGAIWIGDKNGLHLKIEGEVRFEKINSKASLGYITDIIELQNDKICIAAAPKLWEFDPETLPSKISEYQRFRFSLCSYPN